MSFGRKAPSMPEYEEMQDTPYITDLRDLSQRGYEGYRDNYSKVNVFSPETQRSLDDYTNDVYKRAEGDFDRQYRDTMRRMANRNYGQFGTLNATPALYRTDMENLAQQRKLADMAYNKALYRESLVDNELRRRYNTLNMYNQMLEKGQTPYELDLKNWNIRNKNKEIQFQNAIANYNQKGRLGRFIGSVLDPSDIFGLREMLGPTYNAQVSGNSATVNGKNLLNALSMILGFTGGLGGFSGGSLGGLSGAGSGSLLGSSEDILGNLGNIMGSGNSGSAIQDAIGSFISNQSGGGNSIMDAISDYIGGGAGDGSAISNAINSYTSSGGSNLGWLSKLKGLFSKGGGTTTNFFNRGGGFLSNLKGDSSGGGVPWALIASAAKNGYNSISGHGDKDYSDLEETIIYPLQGTAMGSSFGPWGALGGALYGLGYSFKDDIGLKDSNFFTQMLFPFGMGDGGGLRISGKPILNLG